MRALCVTAEVRCPFSAAVEYIDIYHQQRSEAKNVSYTHVVRHVQCEASEIRDVTDETRVHEALLFRWRSGFAVLPPIVHGLVTVRPNGRTTQIRVEATYVPRFGLFGTVLDAIVGRIVVRRMLRAFVSDVRRFVENAYDLERMLQPRMTPIEN